jgi:hypothetical protein
MFMQVITGTVTDADGFRAQDERWEKDIRPGATGYLGSTTGIADDGRFVAAVRFDSPDDARRNSERPEQGAWWSDMQKCVTDVVFHDCSKVILYFGGGSDDAKFVQVMQGRVLDAAALDALEAGIKQSESEFRGFRPDVLGQTTAYHDDGNTYTDIVYFTSEAEARANEQNQPPPKIEQLMGQLMSAVSVDEYIDLKNPVLR